MIADLADLFSVDTYRHISRCIIHLSLPFTESIWLLILGYTIEQSLTIRNNAR